MVIDILKSILAIMLLSSCTTIAGMDHELIPAPKIKNAKNMNVHVEFVNMNRPEELRRSVFEALKGLQVFKNVYAIPALVNIEIENAKNAEQYFTAENIEPSNIVFRVHNEVGWGEFHPFCLLTLAIVPCMVPVNDLLSVKVLAGDKVLGIYNIAEDATQVTWAFGFLLSAAGKQEDKYKMVMANLWSHLLLQMEKDHIFDK